MGTTWDDPKSPGDLWQSEDYNDLVSEVIDTSTGHDHDGPLESSPNQARQV